MTKAVVKNMTEHTDLTRLFGRCEDFTADPQECARSAAISVVRGVPTMSAIWLQFGMHQLPSACRKREDGAPGVGGPNRIETFLQIFKIHTSFPKSRTKEKSSCK